VLALRERQVRNLLTLLLVSQGVPMLLGGDELSRTQRGNNNAYCQDNELSWLDWGVIERRPELSRFVARLIRFRKAHPSLRRRTFFEDETNPPLAWHGARLDHPDWGAESRALGMHLTGAYGDEPIYVFANAHWLATRFELPKLPPGRTWRCFVDTALEPGADILEPGSEAPLDAGHSYTAGPRAVVVLVAR
jgi:glycogen operon protein